MLKVTFLLAIFGVGVFAQDSRCVAPSYFQSRAYEADNVAQFYRYGEYFYDAAEERTLLIERTTIQHNRTEELVLILHREKKQYVVDLVTKKCSVSVPRHEFRPLEVGEGFEYLEDVIIGSVPEDGVDVSIWYRHEHTTDVKGLAIMEFTTEDCLPLYESFAGTIGSQHVNFHRTYFNIVTEMEDPNIFDIPKSCLGK